MTTFFAHIKNFAHPLIIVCLLLLTLICYLFRHRLEKRKIQPGFPPLKMIARDTFFSLISSLAFIPCAIICAICFYYHYGYGYTHFAQYGLFYFICSILLMAIVHDMYCYWAHRMLHLPFFFKHFHYIHHNSRNPTLVTFFAMHPFDCFLFSLSAPISIFLFPVHPTAVVIAQGIHTFSQIYGHNGYEWLPDRGIGRWFSRWINTSLGHNLHHKNVHVNYSFYFLFWDRTAETLDKNYWQEFSEISKRVKTQQL